jgi:proteasome assembly chaperone (PAC2) family protein
MGSEALTFFDRPVLRDGVLVIGLSGWMDGGEVSTGTVEYLSSNVEAQRIAEIESDPFYLYNFPGSMEIASLFRPQVRIEEGLVVEVDMPRNVFHCAPSHNLLLFQGKEPNHRWGDYADCLFRAIEVTGVRRIFFVGTVAGLVPHTRDPRMYSTVSDADLLAHMTRHGCQPSNYSGPGSFVTGLTLQARERGLKMATLVAEVPAYVQGRNLRCIDVVVRKLAEVSGLSLELSDLAEAAREFEERVNEIVAERADLAEMIKRMEEDYDQTASLHADADLKAWLERQGIRLE